MGVIVNLQTKNPVIGSLLFSFGLLTIIYMQELLFTGKIGFVLSAKFYIKNRLILSIIILIFNYIGIALTVGLYAIANQNFIETISVAASAKFAKSIFTLFINGCFCGALIHFAVKNKKTILTIFAVMIFILIGAEHCIADFPYLLFNLSIINIIKLCGIILGNSFGAILIERLCKNEQ